MLRGQSGPKPPRVTKIPKKTADIECNWCGLKMKGNNLKRHNEREEHQYQSYKIQGLTSVANMFARAVLAVKKENQNEEVENEENQNEEVENKANQNDEVEKEVNQNEEVEMSLSGDQTQEVDKEKKEEEKQENGSKKRSRQPTLFEMSGPL